MSTNISDMDRAMDLIARDRISLVDDELDSRFIVEGKTKKYLVVLPAFCSCDHFTFRCLKEKNKVCYHILAALHCKKPKIVKSVDFTIFFE